MKTFRLALHTEKRDEFVNITQRIRRLVASEMPASGMCHIYCPHTTAGITINEAADPDVVSDIIRSMDKAVPWEDGYDHAEGNSAAHIKALLTGSSVQIPVEDGRLLLGRWQGIYFCEYDGPRDRTFLVSLY